MHAIVVGCGRVGSSVAAALEEQGHSVAVIDRNRTAFRRLTEGFAGQRIVGLGFDRDRLLEAGIEEADALAAVTNGDNSNIVVARVARESYGLDRVVARIYDPRRAAIYQRLGISTIATVHWSSEQVLRRILPNPPAVEWTDPSARVHLVERIVPSSLAGTRCDELEQPGRFRLVALGRLGAGRLPEADTLVQEDDLLWFTVVDDATADLDSALGLPEAEEA
ncbi:MAG: hypothetical protein JJLCMIEE_02435 [Acidimicrobiales bacterium]|nr:MAG: TrkA family potassium uptake protein [Actinomycetota bacterium]MBV6509366.1 hypothetical protein [Acidimicrobiales bacterium]RIK04599.1 MAG: potassium transporter TrkA [Acidobacteriota bacterium]